MIGDRHTLGIAYTKLPNEASDEDDSPIVLVVKKSIMHVSRKVRWPCRMV